MQPNSQLTIINPCCVPLQASIISPHVYPPTITGATFLGADLWNQCNTAFGYLQKQGAAPQATQTAQAAATVGRQLHSVSA